MLTISPSAHLGWGPQWMWGGGGSSQSGITTSRRRHQFLYRSRLFHHLLLPGWRTWMDGQMTGWTTGRMDGKEDRRRRPSQQDKTKDIIYSECPWPKATVKPLVWNPGPKIEIPHPENHVLKVFRFRSWKSRMWKSRPQSWDPKSWKPCPENFPGPKVEIPSSENHILKFPRSFCLAALPCLFFFIGPPVLPPSR